MARTASPPLDPAHRLGSRRWRERHRRRAIAPTG
jgi:hypothetical protein